MQTLYKNKDKKYVGRRLYLVGAFICTRMIGRYLEGEYNRRFGK